MMLTNTIKQFFRTPFKAGLLSLLLCLSVLFACMGVSLFHISQSSLAELDRQFTTIGTVEQLLNTVQTSTEWDATQKKYTYYDSPQYDEVLSPDILQFDTVDYIYPPTRLPFYGAYDQNFKSIESINSINYILEARPLEDCIPDHPVEMEIVDVLMGNVGRSKTFYFCDHYNDSPEPLYADTTYLMGLYEFQTMHPEYQNVTLYENVPMDSPATTQSDADGAPVPAQFSSGKYVPITEGFYNTPVGRLWLERMESFQILAHTITVIPADAMHLIMEFHQRTTAITQGREITQEEFDAGEKVCMVAHDLMLENGWKIGDTVPLSLYFANYRNSANGGFRGIAFSLLNAQGELYSPFYSDKFTIVGTYTTHAESLSPYDLHPYSVIIPNQSVPQEQAQDNIVAGGPMKGETTIFQIPNGTIDQFMTAFSAARIENIQVKFYDNGFSELKAGLDNLSAAALVLFFSGLAVFLTTAAFFSYYLIGRNARRFALERALGATKSRCLFSATSAFALVGTLSTVVGAAVSYPISNRIFRSALSGTNGLFDTRFSGWINASDVILTPDWILKANADLSVLVISCVVAVLALGVFAFYFAYRVARQEPMTLLQRG